MPTEAHDMGDQRQLTGSFTNVAGDPVDPATVVLTIREPDGTIISKTAGDLANPQVGSFTYDHTLTKRGRYVVNWAGTLGTIAAGEQEIWCRSRQAVA